MKRLPWGLPAAFWMVWAATLVMWLGRFVVPFLSLFLTSVRGYPPAAAGTILAMYGAGGVLASLLGGAFSDRYGRLGVIVVSKLGGAVLLVALPHFDHPVAMGGALFAYGAISQLAGPALAALIADLVPPTHRTQAFSLQTWAMNFGFAVGPLIAVLLVEISFAWVFYTEALITAAMAILILSRRRLLAVATGGDATVGESASATSGVSRSSFLAGYRVALNDGVFLVFVAMMVGYTIVYFQSTSSLPIAMTGLGLSAGDYARLLTLNGLLLCVLQLPFVRVVARFTPTTVLAVSLVITAVGYGVQVWADSPAGFSVAVTIWTLGELGTFPIAAAMVAGMAPARYRGTYQGLFNLQWSLSHALAPLLGGVALSAWGGQVLWGICATMAAAMALVVVAERGRWLSRIRGPEASGTGTP